tara:strand:+ start:70 stop:414 length:345 start_codon:yes stop_codon:yes gene_type:complete
MNNIIMLIICAFLAQSLAWFQTNGQLLWPIFKEYKWIVFLSSIPTAILYYYTTTFGYPAFNGNLWPVRFVVFTSGILVFILFTTWLLKEPFTLKIFVQIALCFAILLTQMLWKT